jgi:hypothetical protein
MQKCLFWRELVESYKGRWVKKAKNSATERPKIGMFFPRKNHNVNSGQSGNFFATKEGIIQLLQTVFRPDQSIWELGA